MKEDNISRQAAILPETRKRWEKEVAARRMEDDSGVG